MSRDKSLDQLERRMFLPDWEQQFNELKSDMNKVADFLIENQIDMPEDVARIIEKNIKDLYA